MNEDLNEDEIHEALPVTGMYENWFLDYASYVILEGMSLLLKMA